VESILKDLRACAGVEGAYIFDSDGRMAAGVGLERFAAEALCTVARTMSRTFEGLKSARRRKVTELDLVFESERVIVKNLGTGCLILVCTPSINLPLLNLTANLAVRQITSLLETSTAPKAAVAPAPAPPSPAASLSLTQGLESIAAKHMGDPGKKFFLRHLAEAHLGAGASHEQLARWLPGFGYALSYTSDPSDAQQMVDEMLLYLEEQPR